jgi:hypothetical protein
MVEIVEGQIVELQNLGRGIDMIRQSERALANNIVGGIRCSLNDSQRSDGQTITSDEGVKGEACYARNRSGRRHVIFNRDGQRAAGINACDEAPPPQAGYERRGQVRGRLAVIVRVVIGNERIVRTAPGLDHGNVREIESVVRLIGEV